MAAPRDAAITVRMTDAPIDLMAVLDAVEGRGEGAAVLFVGRVRDHTGDRDVTHLDYEAYGSMAAGEMESLAEQARTEHGAARVAIVHRTGRLEIGEAAVAIAVSSGHRPAAFAACRWLIDTLKERVPIWKKECFADGEEWISDRP